MNDQTIKVGDYFVEKSNKAAARPAYRCTRIDTHIWARESSKVDVMFLPEEVEKVDPGDVMRVC